MERGFYLYRLALAQRGDKRAAHFQGGAGGDLLQQISSS